MSAVVLMGSPRRGGRCAALADTQAAVLAARSDIAAVERLDIPDLSIAGCRGCAGCDCAPDYRCVIRDDMDRVNEVLARAERLIVVSPVYFAGPPAQLKALLDRLQPHFWRGTRAFPRRPAQLQVVGEGGDPHGYDPLVTIVRSSLAVAGFSLESVEAHIGLEGKEAYDA